jgi:hypothetical protein
MRTPAIILKLGVILALDTVKDSEDWILERMGRSFAYRTKNSIAHKAYTIMMPMNANEREPDSTRSKELPNCTQIPPNMILAPFDNASDTKK